MVDNVLIMVTNCATSLELWEMFAKVFMSQSKARYMPLNMQIQLTKKSSFSISDYFNKMKTIANNLAIGGNVIYSNELIMHLLTRLDDNYESIVINILTRLEKEQLTIEEVYSIMLNHANRLEMNKGKLQSEIPHDITVNLTQKEQTYGKSGYTKNTNSGHYRGYDANNNAGGAGKELIYQICLIPGHGAYKCKNKFNQGFIPRNRNFNGSFRPRGVQNLRGFCRKQSEYIQERLQFHICFNNFGPRF